MSLLETIKKLFVNEIDVEVGDIDGGDDNCNVELYENVTSEVISDYLDLFDLDELEEQDYCEDDDGSYICKYDDGIVRIVIDLGLDFSCTLGYGEGQDANCNFFRHYIWNGKLDELLA